MIFFHIFYKPLINGKKFRHYFWWFIVTYRISIFLTYLRYIVDNT